MPEPVMSAFAIACSEAQQKILNASQYLFLTPEEQVNFHFMVHSRSVLKSPNFMEAFEDELMEQKFALLQARCPFFAELDYQQSYIPLPKYLPEELTPEQFQRLLQDPATPPIVIKGLLNDAPAVRKWTHEYLMKTFGKVEVLALEFAQDGSYQAVDRNAHKLNLADIVTAQLDKRNHDNYYINNSAQVFNDHPELVEEIGGEKILDLFRGHSLNTFSQLFVGNLRTWGTNWHQGNDLSCALMIHGVKRWYFLDPRLVYLLRPYLNGPNGMQTKGEVRHALDFQVLSNPLYAYAPKFVVDLEPGDALIFTKYWPHAVVNVSPYQIMANMRMTEVDLANMKKGNSAANLLPVFDNILNSDPEFIKFKFEIFQSLGKREKDIGDKQYFSSYSVTRKGAETNA